MVDSENSHGSFQSCFFIMCKHFLGVAIHRFYSLEKLLKKKNKQAFSLCCLCFSQSSFERQNKGKWPFESIDVLWALPSVPYPSIKVLINGTVVNKYSQSQRALVGWKGRGSRKFSGSWLMKLINITKDSSRISTHLHFYGVTWMHNTLGRKFYERVVFWWTASYKFYAWLYKKR